MGKHLIMLALLALGQTAWAQQAKQKIGDFIESTSYNLDKTGIARSQQYYPEDGAFVCYNGQNRYTRALYGSHTDWRLETSDRPVFAVVKKGHHRNIRFELDYRGRSYRLDQLWCEAHYGGKLPGARVYLMHDPQLADTLGLVAVARPDREGAVWTLFAPFLGDSARLRAIVCPIAQPKLHRNGDIGADKPGCLEAADSVVQEVTVTSEEGGCFMEIDVDEVRPLTLSQVRQDMHDIIAHYAGLASRIQFDTPDPYINTLGSALVLAADGDWDGKTWLHGCVGWRMPLAGWRAGYLGDVLGWQDRAVSHFDAYAKSQVTEVPPTIPHPSQDAKMNLARAEKRWGTQMYSNGYICRNPERNDQMHHYDMNLNYIDELLWHFQYDADTAYMQRMWPVIERHLAWEKRNFDPDGDHLYDAYCCIWASDALYYSGGAVTHSSAYNYRGNRLAARIAEIIGEDPQPYREEAEAILRAMNERLWITEKGVWAECQDAMGLKRRHDHPAVWSIYTPIDCGACTPEQAYLATRYVDDHIPHIRVDNEELRMKNEEFATALPQQKASDNQNAPSPLYTISTSDWMPYSWSINNVAAAEVMHTALAYYEAGRSEEAFRLMKGNIMDQMYLGQSPGNFGQISHYDAARGECYRDFGDCIGISARTLLQGLFGIVPQALDGVCILRPGLPQEWESASVKTPYLEYKFLRVGDKDVYEVRQHFSRPLKIVLKRSLGEGRFETIEGTDEEWQVIEVPTRWRVEGFERKEEGGKWKEESGKWKENSTQGLERQRYVTCDIGGYFNAEVDDIFKNEYRSPRPQTTTLQIPLQGIGEWCHPQLTAEINDSVFRTLIRDGVFEVAGVPFLTPKEGRNIVYTSLWDNYPDAVTIPLSGRASTAWLLMAGSTNHMQSRIDNGLVIATYTDGAADTLALRNPDNWCPIEQDYYVDGKAFQTAQPRPYRVCLGTGTVSRDLGAALGIRGVYGREIPGGAAQMLQMALNPGKDLQSLTVRTLSNDVVIGLMAVTLQ